MRLGPEGLGTGSCGIRYLMREYNSQILIW